MSRRGRSFALLCVLSTLSTWAVAGDKSAGDTPCAGQITYQSDKDDAYKYLEEQQRQIYTANPQLTDAYSREELNKPGWAKRWADVKALALKACPDPSKRSQCPLDPDMVDWTMSAVACPTLPTRFESPLFFLAIKVFITELDKVRLSHYPQSSMTRFGSLPTGTFDAQTILPKGSKVPLIILNRDIFYFTGAFSAALADSIPIRKAVEGGVEGVELDSSEAGIRRRLRDYPYIVHNFADAMSRLVQEGSSAGAIRKTVLDKEHNPLLARLLLAMYEFLIAHEEAHVILGHVSGQSVDFQLAGSHNEGALAQTLRPRAHKHKRPSRSPADKPFATLKAELRTREQEFEADAIGFKLMMWAQEQGGDPVGVEVAAAAPHVVFRILDATNAYGSEAGGWTFGDANHPTAADRIENLASWLFDEVETKEAIRGADWRIRFDAAFKVLLEEADPQIRQNLGLKTKDTK